MWTLVLIAQTLHFLYHLVTTNVDFFPFNNIRDYTRKQRIVEVLVNAPVMIFPIVATSINQQNLITISCWVLGITFFMELVSWWRHYFFGATKKWQEVYDTIFAKTIIILPPIKNNPVPNLEHCILHMLTLISFVLTLLYSKQI